MQDNSHCDDYISEGFWFGIQADPKHAATWASRGIDSKPGGIQLLWDRKSVRARSAEQARQFCRALDAGPLQIALQTWKDDHMRTLPPSKTVCLYDDGWITIEAKRVGGYVYLRAWIEDIDLSEAKMIDYLPPVGSTVIANTWNAHKEDRRATVLGYLQEWGWIHLVVAVAKEDPKWTEQKERHTRQNGQVPWVTLSWTEFGTRAEDALQDKGFTLVKLTKAGERTLSRPLYEGSLVRTFKDEWVQVRGGRPPHKTSSTGHVDTNLGEFYPSVINATWRNNADKGKQE